MGEKRAVIIAFVVLLLTALQAGAQEKIITDQEITRSVSARLAASTTVPPGTVAVQSLNGVVTLSGTVPNLIARERAESIVSGVQGVQAVDNRIVVAPQARQDSEIRSDIENLISGVLANGSQVEVSVADGIVTLSGSVQSNRERSGIVDIVKHASGLRGVVDDLVVRSEGPVDPDEIRIAVERRLREDIWVEDRFVKVQVDGTKVIISGTVGSVAGKNHAADDGWVKGVTAVDAAGLKIDHRVTAMMQSQQAAQLRADRAIEEAVPGALRQVRVRVAGLQTTVDNGEVTLSGRARDPGTRERAAQAVAALDGVRNVINNIAVPQYVPRANRAVADDIHEVFKGDPFLDSCSIAIEVDRGIVTLTGTVYNYIDKLQAGNDALSVEGVRKVDNNITVKFIGRKGQSDEKLEREIVGRLRCNPRVRADRIDVSVQQGVVTVTGSADTWAEKSAALNEVYNSGANSVIDKIVYEGFEDD